MINSDNTINIIESRHPVVEKVIKDNYVANDIVMDSKTNIILITGPNMAGKSTYMRQLGIIAIMAQIGCFVPAKEASLPIFDQIFTRIGASDDLVSGESTFMVEMMEASNAIKNATSNSLILFDELGRGTSTYDGMSLAGSIITYISVLERTKEIGILRAVGASKKDITRVFNAETVIEGILSGVFGVGITLLLNIPINIIINNLIDVANMSKLPFYGGLGLLILSIFLNIIAGSIPSKMASKKDPVEALRSE